MEVEYLLSFKLHYVHQLLANFVWVLFGAEQVVYSGWKQLPAAGNDTDESNEAESNHETTTKLKWAKNPHRAGGIAE